MTDTATPAPVAPDPRPLRAALAKAERAKADLAEFKEVTIPAWQAEYAELVKSGDPHDPAHLRDAAHAAERVEMAMNYRRKYERELVQVMNATLPALVTFERSFLSVAQAEHDALLDEVAVVLRPYCRDVEQRTEGHGFQMVDGSGMPLANKGIHRIVASAAIRAALVCDIFSYIPLTPAALAEGYFDPAYQSALLGGAEHLVWLDVPTFEEAAVAAGFGPDGKPRGRSYDLQIGGFNPADVQLASGVRHDHLPGEEFRMPENYGVHASIHNGTFERLVWGRAEAVLKRFEEWHANGDRFVPANFADLGPLMLPEAALPVVPQAALNLGGTAKDMRAHGGHGVPAVDLQGMKL